MREIAAHAGVSAATVSRVINNGSDVSPGTREKVVAAIEALGFVPDSTARAFALGRTQSIGTVLPTLSHTFYSRFLQSLELSLAAENYSMIIATANDAGPQELERVQALLKIGVDGLIMPGKQRDDAFAALVGRYRKPVVFASIYEPSGDFPTIGYDNFGLAVSAMRHLIDLDHRHIALLHSDISNNDRVALRVSGALSTASEATIYPLQTELSERGGMLGARRLLELTPRPTALFCCSDVIALGALLALDEANIDVPGEMSLMGVDNLDWTEHTSPPLTTIALPSQEMGERVAKSLLGYLEDGAPIMSSLLPVQIIERGSTAAAPGR